MKKITIRKGWFYGAGTVYGWRNAGLHINGVGLPWDTLLKEPKIRIDVAVGGTIEKYVLECPKAVEFVRQYQSFKVIRKKRLGIVSKSILTIYEPKKKAESI